MTATELCAKFIIIVKIMTKYLSDEVPTFNGNLLMCFLTFFEVFGGVISCKSPLKYKKSWMFHNAHKLSLPRIIRDSIAFDPARRRKFDLEVATQLAIAAATKIVEQRAEKTDLSEIWSVVKSN